MVFADVGFIVTFCECNGNFPGQVNLCQGSRGSSIASLDASLYFMVVRISVDNCLVSQFCFPSTVHIFDG
jgi:hypothetical protein